MQAQEVANVEGNFNTLDDNYNWFRSMFPDEVKTMLIDASYMKLTAWLNYNQHGKLNGECKLDGIYDMDFIPGTITSKQRLASSIVNRFTITANFVNGNLNGTYEIIYRNDVSVVSDTNVTGRGNNGAPANSTVEQYLFNNNKIVTSLTIGPEFVTLNLNPNLSLESEFGDFPPDFYDDRQELIPEIVITHYPTFDYSTPWDTKIQTALTVCHKVFLNL